MSNPNFIDAMSTNEIYRDLDHTRCLTDDLDAIEADIKGLATEKAPANHTHSGYAETSHNHDGAYSPSSHTHNYADANHTHTAASVGAIATAMLSMLGIAENGDVQVGVHSGSTENVLEKLKSLGAGMHTAYSAKGIAGNPNPLSAFRFICHFTSATEAGASNGWCIGISTAGDVYECVISGGTWQPWHAIYEKNPEPLWVGGLYMADTHTVTPSKKLSECQHGWLLLWSDYDANSHKASDYEYCTTMIPKHKGDNNLWSGQKYLCRVEAFASEASPYTAEKTHIKPIKVYDDKIVGNIINNQAGREDVVLRAIYEF